MVAMPVEKVVRLPSVMSLKPSDDVSVTMACDIVIGDAELLRRHQAHGGARAADIGRAERQRDRAVDIDRERHRGVPPKLNQKPQATPRP